MDNFTSTLSAEMNRNFNNQEFLSYTMNTTEENGKETTQVTTIAGYYINVIYIIIAVVGIIGNLFVLIVIFSLTNMRKKVTNIFIINQTFTDVVAAISLLGTTMHFWTLENLENMGNIVGGELLCRLWLTKLPLWASLFASNLNLVAVTIERYFEVVYPLLHKVSFTKEKAMIFVVLIWVTSLLFQGGWIIPTSGLQQDACVLLGFWPNHATQKAVGFINAVIIFFLPISILGFCYIKMALAMKNKIAPLTSGATGINNTSSKNHKLGRNIFKTLVTVSACFFICYISNQVLFLMYSVGYPLDFSSAFYHFSVIMVFLNCCINPFIYSTRYRELQNGIVKLLICLHMYNPKPSSKFYQEGQGNSKLSSNQEQSTSRSLQNTTLKNPNLLTVEGQRQRTD